MNQRTPEDALKRVANRPTTARGVAELLDEAAALLSGLLGHGQRPNPLGTYKGTRDEKGEG